MNAPINCCARPEMRSRVQSRLLAKAGESATFAPKLKMKRAGPVFQLYVNLLGTGWGEKCTRNRNSQLRQTRQRPEIKSRHDARNRADDQHRHFRRKIARRWMDGAHGRWNALGAL